MPGRCFVAVDLPERAISALLSTRDVLVSEAPTWADEKWVGPANLHVTLAFLGPVADPSLEATLRAIAPVGAQQGPFRMRLDGIRAVPNARRATMVWATVDCDADLSPLRDGILRAAACPADTRPFRPHITLVRARRPHRIEPSAIASAARPLSDAGKEPDGWMSVRTLTVYSSTLGPTGPTYRRLAELPLAAH